MTALFGIHPEMLVLPVMFAGIGFFLAALIAVALSPAIHRRAERLTKRRLGESVPPSIQDLRAEKDHLRAQHAMATREMTLGMEKLHEKAALQGAELGRKTEKANRLKIALEEKAAALAAIEQRASGVSGHSEDLRAELAAAHFEANASRMALRDAEQAIMALQSDIAELTTVVESRSRLIDRQQHDIMMLTAQIERASRLPDIPAPIAAHAKIKTEMQASPVMQMTPASPPVRETPRARTPGVVSFEARLAAIRDDKPLRDVRPQMAMKRAISIEPAPQAVELQRATPQPEKTIPTPATPIPLRSIPTPPTPIAQTPAADANVEPARVATDIRYDEPLSTADLIELGKAMLRQTSKDGLPHKTH